MSEFADLTYLIAAKQAANLEAARDAQYLAEYGDSRWKINNSSWQSYSADVYFPGLGQTLDEVVTDLSCESSEGLDVAGGTEGKAMLDLIHEGILSHAAVTNYEDHRPVDEEDRQLLTRISGDLLLPDTWRKIFRWRHQVAPTGLKLITHMPRDILQGFDPIIYERTAHLLVDSLAPGAVLASQIPKPLNRIDRNAICRRLESRPDVTATFISQRRGDYSHALILKAA